VLGVDACAKGWVGIALGVGASGIGARAFFDTTMAGLVRAADHPHECSVVAIDMPIGLPDAGRRAADVRARALLGPRRQSVFMTPTRTAIEAPTHPEAIRINREHAGEGVSAQAYGLARKVLEVDQWVRSGSRTVIEIHPEVSFATMAGRPLGAPKKSWAGMQERLALLQKAGIPSLTELGPAGTHAGVDDVLDAAAGAWTAWRYASGAAFSLPEDPEVNSDGIPAAIWA
jgi:predicted RNase H-like nuclease